ncbi:hypothetical protein RUM44_002431 [Polyplax serrata]|uniref:Phosphotransferase n=1 Tax=Polyplax serrata TaxID=468196 RepID=A0ABR1AES1_POLSC
MPRAFVFGTSKENLSKFNDGTKVNRSEGVDISTEQTGDYVAKCVNNFLDSFGIYDRKTILGVSSTFPMKQETLQDGTIVNWNNEFADNENSGDFFTQLKVSLKKYKVGSTRGYENTKRIYLISMVRSSTASLISGLYRDPLLRIGVHLGDNINITYIEKYKNMTAYTGDGLRTRTAIDVDVQSFGDDGALDFIRTEFDFQIDSASKNPGKFLMEKLTSALYLGEIARLCLYKLASTGAILNGYASPALSTNGSLKTVDLALMEMQVDSDEEKKFTRCRAVMYNLGYSKVSDSDCIQIRFVARCVARRSSNLVAACLTAMIHRMESRDVRIIGDGLLLKDFPNYEYYLVKKINQLKKQEIRYQISKGEKEDIGAGAGLVAHIYKDGYIKLEDKHRALPPFNALKYQLQELPASCTDCNEPKKSSASERSFRLGSLTADSMTTAESFIASISSRQRELCDQESILRTIDYVQQ